MVPIVQESTGQVSGMIAVKDASAISGSNLSVAVYRRSAGGVWSAATWTNGIAAASAWLGANGESVALAEIEGIVTTEVGGSGFVQGPTTLVGGVEEGDEFEELVLDPVVGPSVLSLLVAWGYPAADVPVSGDAGVEACEENAVLDAALAGFTAEAGNLPGGSAAVFSASLASSCVAWCIPWSWTTDSTAWSEWSCGPWTFKSGPMYRSSCIDQCTYERAVSRTRTRDKWSLALDCSYTLIIYRQTESGTQTGTCDLELTGVGCLSGSLACPVTPACDLSATLCSAGPMDGTSRSGWEVVP